MCVTLDGIVGALTNEVQPLNVLFKSITLEGVAGALTNDLQPEKVAFISVSGIQFPFVSSSITFHTYSGSDEVPIFTTST